MAAEPCKKCGKLRKVDIIISSAGWHQPQCYNCGDPEYIEDDISICPECVQGKHQNCDRTAWNNTKDEETKCPCTDESHNMFDLLVEE